MSRSPLIDIRAFADDRAKDADVLTTRLNQLFEPMVGPMPQDGQGGLSMGQPVQVAGPPQEPPQQASAPQQSAPQGQGLAASNPALVQSESGGNFQARNDVMGSGGRGHFGRGQFSRARLQDAQRAGVIPNGMTPEQFLDDPQAQVAVEQWHEQDIRNTAQSAGVMGRVGETINGVPITDQGVVNVAHLGGNAGMKRFFETDGAYNPADANGTRLSDYLAMGAQSAGPDDMYRTVGDALGVTTSTSGETTPEERRTVEGDLGAILNETQNPDSVVAANKRQGVADLFTGLGIGFGQMSRGDRVDLSEVRDAAAQRRREQTALRMERAKRAAGASYAMELGDEGMARAIAGGAANIGDLLTVRQQKAVEQRANAKILRETQSRTALAGLMRKDGSYNDETIAAIEAGVSPQVALKVTDQSRAAELAIEAEEEVETTISGLEQMYEESKGNLPEGYAEAIAFARAENYDSLRKNPEKSFFDTYIKTGLDAAGEARQQAKSSGSGPSPEQQALNLQNAEIALAAPDATAASRASAQAVQRSEGQLSMSDAAKEVTAGGGYGEPDGPSAEVRNDNLMSALAALRDPDAPEATQAAADLVQDSQGRMSMKDAVAQVTAGGAFASEAAPTAREQNIEVNTRALVEDFGVPEPVAGDYAEGLESGRYEQTTHPETGSIAIYDKMRMLLGGSQQDAQVFPPPNAPSDYAPASIVPETADFSEVFGPEGVVKNLLNNFGEAVGLGLIDPASREAFTAVTRYAQNGKIAQAIAVGGRPNQKLLEMYESLETNPGEFFTGPETALIKLSEQRAGIVRDLQELDQILAPNAPFTTKTREEAAIRRNAQQALLNDADIIINGIRRGQQQTNDNEPLQGGTFIIGPDGNLVLEQ